MMHKRSWMVGVTATVVAWSTATVFAVWGVGTGADNGVESVERILVSVALTGTVWALAYQRTLEPGEAYRLGVLEGRRRVAAEDGDDGEGEVINIRSRR